MTEILKYHCRCVVSGKGSGEAVVSEEPMCFYLCNPETGEVIEKNHPLQGKTISGKILVLKSGKGSSVVQVDGLYQLWSKGNLPAAIIVKEPDPVLVSAAVVVGVAMVDKMEKDPFKVIKDGDFVVVDAISESVEIRSKKS